MHIVEILIISVGLAMDALAVSITGGTTKKTFDVRLAATMGVFFGFFQALMPVLGWLAGNGLRAFIVNVDHWIAFALLFLIGLKMLLESFQKNSDELEMDFLHYGTLLLLAVATSIDAFAVGISFSFLNQNILLPIVVIGMVTFFISFAGVYAGTRYGHLLGDKFKAIGGLILIAIGAKILIEHLRQTPFSV